MEIIIIMVKQVIKNVQGKFEKYVKENEQSFFSRIYINLLTTLRPFYFSDEFLLMKGLKKKSSRKD